MDWLPGVYIISLCVSTAVALGLAFVLWARRTVPGIAPLAFSMLAAAVWSLGNALQFALPEPADKIFWNRMVYLGIGAIPAAWVVFAMQFSGRAAGRDRRILALLSLEPLAVLVLAWTQGAHHLLWTETVPSSPLANLRLTYSPLFNAHALYSYSLILIGAALLLQPMFQSPPRYRSQALTLVASAVAPFLANLVFFSRLGPLPGLDLTPAAFTITGVILAWGLRRFWLFQVVPLARSAIFEDLSEGVMVLDPSLRVIDLNHTAARLIGRSLGQVIGQPAAAVVPGWAGLTALKRAGVEDGGRVFSSAAPPQDRHYDLVFSPLEDRRGVNNGYLLLWRDLTDQRRAQAVLQAEEAALQRQLTELTVLQDVARACADATGDDELLEQITTTITRSLYHYHFGVLLVDPETGGLRFHPSYPGLPEEWRERVWSVREGAGGQAGCEGPCRTFTADKPRCPPIWDSTRSKLCAPVAVAGQTVAVLNLESDQPDAFDQADERLLVTVAGQLATALERRRAEAAERCRIKELLAITRISREITSVLDLPEVLASIVRLAADMSGSDASGLFGYRSGGRFTLLAAHGVGQPFVAALNSGGTLIEGSAVGRAIHLRRPVQIDDLRGDPEYGARTLADQEGIRAILALPMLHGEEAIGGIVLWHRRPRKFTQEEQVFLQAMAQQSVTAIENARLFAAEREQRRLAEALREVGTALSASLDFDSVLDQLLEQLEGMVPFDAANIMLVDDGAARITRARGYERFGQAAASEVIGLELSILEKYNLQSIVATGRPARIAEIDDHPGLFQKGASAQIHSWAGAPVVVQGQVVAIFSLDKIEPDFYTAQHLELLALFAGQASLALQNARLFDEARRRAAELEALNAQVQQIINSVPEGVLLLDAERRVVLANPIARQYLPALTGEAEASLDRPLCTLAGKPVETLLREDPGRPWFDLESNGARPAIFEAAARPLQGRLGAEGWVLVLRDVSKERESQARLGMQERLATVGQLAAGIAHDFNNIMAAIIVYTDLLALEPNLSPASSERLDIIQSQVQRATSLIRQVLDFSRRSVMEQVDLDLLPFIKELDKLLGRVLPETIRLKLGYQPGAYWVKADPTRLQQVFMNLAVNARDAMPAGGVLHFELARLRLAREDPNPVPDLLPGEWIHISVSDTGDGIPAETLPHIFDPFFTTKPAGQGTGLGLAQVYGIIKQHGGSIDVYSRPGEGSAFHLYLPALEIPAPAQASAQPPLEGLGIGRVALLVEDDGAAREALRALLERQMFQVLTATNGTEALRLFSQEEDLISVVVSDVVMPEMGGVALYGALRERQPRIKTLFVTGHPLSEADRELLQAGQVHWLQKPFSILEFTLALQELMGSD